MGSPCTSLRVNLNGTVSKKKRKPADWEEAKRRCRLNDDDIRMAKELGMAAGSLIKNIPAPSQMWKLPVKEWVRELYDKKFGSASRDPTYGGDSELRVLRFGEPDELAAPQRAAGSGPTGRSCGLPACMWRAN